MTKQIMPFLVYGTILMLGLAACEITGGELTKGPSTPSTGITEQLNALATPYAQEPAAGICTSFEGQMVKVIINQDIPDPRCAKVRADQKLMVVNHTQDTLQISIGRFTASLESGKETIIDTPFGEYLEVGVHQLQVSPCCGPELWLEKK
jgi:hypothetical protein